MPTVYLGLGSNIPDQLENLKGGILQIQNEFSVSGVSSIYRTKPHQMVSSNFFLNACMRIEVEKFSPSQILSRIQKIECFYGRNPQRDVSIKTDRRLDIDILLYDEKIFRSDSLILPHPGIISRDFFLSPLLELNPKLKDPDSGLAYADILEELPSTERTIEEKLPYNLKIE